MAKPTKQIFSHSMLSKAVALACLSITSAPVLADSCVGTSTTISTTILNDACDLGAGESVEVTATGALTGSTTTGVSISGGVVAGSITNSGTISVSDSNTVYGILLNANSSLTGGVTNSGTISGSASSSYDGYGIYLDTGASIANGITNSGVIKGIATDTTYIGAGIFLPASTSITGGITNSGTILGSGGTNGYGIYLSDSGITGGITNSGVIKGIATASSAFGIYLAAGSSITGGITNTGVIKGTGTTGIGIYLTGSSSVAGGITNSGTISGIGTDAANGIAIYGTSSITGGITNSGTISASGGGSVTRGIIIDDSSITGGIINSGVIKAANTGNDNADAIGVFNSTVDSITNSGTITGERFAISLDATSVVTNGISNEAGGQINGRISLLNGNNLSNAGILSLPDNTTSTIGGNYTQTGNGNVEFGVSSAASYATLTVNGTTNLSANNQLVIKVSSGDTLADGDVLDNVLTYGTLAAGTPSVTDNRALLDFTAADDGANIDITAHTLTVAQAAASLSGSNPSLTGVAGALDTIIASGPAGDLAAIVAPFDEINETDFVAALNQLTPSFSAGVASATLNMNRAGGSQVVHNRIGQLSGIASGDVVPDRYLWAQPFGSWTTQDTRSGVYGYDASTTGLAIGTDAKVNNHWRLGGAVSYARSSVDDNTSIIDEALDIESYQATVYASGTVLGDKTLNLQASLGTNDNETERRITFGGLNREAKADFDSWHTQLGAEMLYTPIGLNAKTTLTPVVGIDYSYVNVDGYTEKGAGAANLKVKDTSEDSLVLSLGGRFAHQLNDDTILTAHLDVGHDFMADQSSVTSTFTGGGPSFQTEGIEPASTVVKAGVGMKVLTKDNLEISANYDVEARSDYDNQSASVKLRWQF